MADITVVFLGTFFGGLTLRILAALTFDALALRRSGGR